MIGRRFGELVVLGIAGSDNGTLWRCKCDCGNETVRLGGALRRKEKIGQAPFCGDESKHRYYDTPLFRIYWNMVNRCNCPSSTAYKNYGARGIRVCDQWSTGFLEFQKWARASGYEVGLSIERDDVNGNYEPANCRWIPVTEQNLNKRNSRRLTWNGKTQSPREWADELGIPFDVIQLRVTRGWSTDRVLSQSIRGRRD